MKRKILLIFFISIAFVILMACNVNVNAAGLTNISIVGPDTIRLYDNSQRVGSLAYNQITYEHYSVKFSSSNTSIATVNSTTGAITTKRPGTVTITATAKGAKASKKINITTTLLSTFGKVNITETSKTIKTSGTDPYLKRSNNTWCLNFHGYNGVSVKSNGTSYPNGAVALYTIQGIRGQNPNKSFLTASTNANKTYFVKGKGTNFSIIGYKWSPNYSSYQSFLQAIYNEIVAGYPVAVHVYNSANQDIYVVAYGVNSTNANKRAKGKLSASDICVIDTSNGSWNTLDKFREYKQNGKYVLGIHDSSNSNLTNQKVKEMVNFAKSLKGKGLSECKTSFKNAGISYQNYNGAWCSWFVYTLYKHYGFTNLAWNNSKGFSFADNWRVLGDGRYHKKSSGYTPKQGDLILFDYNANGVADHVGMIVNYKDANNITIVDGNISSKVRTGNLPTSNYSPRTSQVMGYYSVSK